MSLSGITFSGLASGIDVDSIISQLINIESQRINRLQTQQSQLQAQQTVYGQFRTQLNNLNGSLSALNLPSLYSAVKGTSSDEEVATISTTSAAQAGTYGITVNALAEAHKISSAAQANATDEVGLAGDFIVNGKGVSVEATDSLNSIAAKINGSGAGVIASVLNGGSGQTYLILTAEESGADNQVQVADLNGSVLSSLGLVSGGTAVRDDGGDANAANSFGFDDDLGALSSIFGFSKSGSFTIGAGASVINIDFDTDSLQSIAAAINAAGEAGVSATVVTTEVDNETIYQLQISGADVPGTLTDTDGLLESLGVLQRGYGDVLVAAADAEVVIDNVTVRQSTNSITDVIQGVTLNVQDLGTSTIKLTRDNGSIESAVKAIQSSFNDVIDFIESYSAFDEETFQSGILFGDRTASQIESALNTMLFSNLGSGTFKNLTDIGFGLDSDGKLTLDEGELSKAIATDVTSVRELLVATGTSANSSIKFVSSSDDTVASPTSGYSVDISQAATKSVSTADTSKTLGNVAGEVLTFSGSLFGSNSIDLSLDLGSSLDDIVSKINSDSRLKDFVKATNDGGFLKVESKRWGSAGAFSLVSNLAAAGDTSGVGLAGGTTVDGVDVAGTINGEAATGNGQFLLGDEDNENTAGLQIQYTGTTTGVIGAINFNRGLAAEMNYRINSYTDSVDGLLSVSEDSITDQIEDIDQQIENLRELVALREQNLRRQFLAMETSIAQLNSQSGLLSSFLGG